MDSASFCLTCNKRPSCKAICPALEATLPKPGSGRNRREFSVDPQKIEKLAEKRVFSLLYGKKYGRKVDNEGSY